MKHSKPRVLLVLAIAGSGLWAQAPHPPAPAASESHPPYFNFKARQFLIEGSHSIAPVVPIRVGNTRQLMFDRQVIDDAWGVERTVHQPVKYEKNPVLPGEPQYSKAHFGSCFRFDQERSKFRLWAQSWDQRRAKYAKSQFGAYFESSDAVVWTAPELGLVEMDGSRKNNVIRAENGVLPGAMSVLEVPPRLRHRGKFAMLYGYSAEKPRPGETHGMEVRIAWSEDGLRWADQPENPVIHGRSDTFNNIVYNPGRDVFMMYRRPSVNANQIRRIAYSESRDLITWSQPQTILFPDESDPAAMFYSLVVVPYQGMYVGFLQNFYLYTDNPSYAGPVRNGPKSHQLDIELAWSRDGLRWDRHPRHPVFLETGAPGSYDWGMISVHQGLFEKDGRISLLYSGTEALHVNAQVKAGRGSSLCLATLRQDGFVSLDAPKEGYVLTKPLLIPGGKLHINAQTEPGGFIRVALRRGDGVKDGDWLDGWSYEQSKDFRGDSADATMSWAPAASLDGLKDRSIRLHFWMNKARLYSFWFE
ncbi:MAG: hypothetical protein HY736_09540 [Verrucomicrobia bacterium]|nr:hypothetical protein [Verrucomicrobiota bacterium]